MINCIRTDTREVSDSDNTLSRNIETSPEYKDGRFNNMENTLIMSFTEYFSTTWEFLFSKNDRTPDTALPVKPVDLTYFNNRDSGRLNVAWLGHSSLMINIDGYKILPDPVFEKRVSMLGPTRFNGDVPLDYRQIPQVDAVIISHDHYDHLNKFSIQSLTEKTHKFVVPWKVGDLLVDWGVPRDKIIELGWWQEHMLDQELMVVATPAQHFSGRGITDRNQTLWASWVIKTPNHNLFFSGDSGF